jgi:hypothetical protein
MVHGKGVSKSEGNYDTDNTLGVVVGRIDLLITRSKWITRNKGDSFCIV